ncbi:hypothetical protein ADUPG1_005903 [Aduncisulcus paluster]|uniref:Spindle assembly abnormal protein 6 N-terminal domain-containing protein n=1 Tax=Aduncisulcus paluster TaxID=2918883 RepID=A0ABQ5KG25_9EUKA|nr:hypothetical protein ADUPG1_005903 [Aduncisulcus paluster]
MQVPYILESCHPKMSLFGYLSIENHKENKIVISFTSDGAPKYIFYRISLDRDKFIQIKNDNRLRIDFKDFPDLLRSWANEVCKAESILVFVLKIHDTMDCGPSAEFLLEEQHDIQTVRRFTMKMEAPSHEDIISHLHHRLLEQQQQTSVARDAEADAKHETKEMQETMETAEKEMESRTKELTEREKKWAQEIEDLENEVSLQKEHEEALIQSYSGQLESLKEQDVKHQRDSQEHISALSKQLSDSETQISFLKTQLETSVKERESSETQWKERCSSLELTINIHESTLKEEKMKAQVVTDKCQESSSMITALSSKVDTLEREIASKDALIAAKQSLYQQTQESLHDCRKRLSLLDQELASSTDSWKSCLKDIELLRTKIDSKEREITHLKHSEGEIKSRLISCQADCVEKAEKIAELNGKLEKKTEDYRESHASVLQLTKKLAQAQTKEQRLLQDVQRHSALGFADAMMFSTHPNAIHGDGMMYEEYAGIPMHHQSSPHLEVDSHQFGMLDSTAPLDDPRSQSGDSTRIKGKDTMEGGEETQQPTISQQPISQQPISQQPTKFVHPSAGTVHPSAGTVHLSAGTEHVSPTLSPSYHHQDHSVYDEAGQILGQYHHGPISSRHETGFGDISSSHSHHSNPAFVQAMYDLTQE